VRKMRPAAEVDQWAAAVGGTSRSGRDLHDP